MSPTLLALAAALLAIAWLVVDRSQRHRDHAALDANSTSLLRVFDTIPITVAEVQLNHSHPWITVDSRVRFLNRGLMEAAGNDPDHLQTVASTLAVGWPDEAAALAHLAWWNAQVDRLRIEGGVATQEARANAMDGKVRDAIFRASVVGDQLLVTIQDVTEDRAKEARIREQREQASHMSRLTSLGQLAAMIGHELSQPVGAIRNNAESIRLALEGDAPAVDDLRETVADILADAERAAAVLERIRRFVRRRPAEHGSLSIATVLPESLALVNSSLAANGIAIDVAVEDGLPPVQADRVLIQQAILNLVLNAADATAGRPGARIEVRATRTGDRGVTITVIDNGGGVPAELEQRLLEPFWTTKPDGLGMGLAIVAAIIEDHGGSLRLGNRPGEGMAVSFSLPSATS
jgi:C4-dicarboxylate-specific signal transduction histidine kinase